MCIKPIPSLCIVGECGFTAFGTTRASQSLQGNQQLRQHCRCYDYKYADAVVAGGGCGERRAGAVAPLGSLEPKWHNAAHLNPTPHAPANDNLSALVHFCGVYWQYWREY